jgi:hypothetical protein
VCNRRLTTGVRSCTQPAFVGHPRSVFYRSTALGPCTSKPRKRLCLYYTDRGANHLLVKVQTFLDTMQARSRSAHPCQVTSDPGERVLDTGSGRVCSLGTPGEAETMSTPGPTSTREPVFDAPQGQTPVPRVSLQLQRLSLHPAGCLVQKSQCICKLTAFVSRSVRHIFGGVRARRCGTMPGAKGYTYTV